MHPMVTRLVGLAQRVTQRRDVMVCRYQSRKHGDGPRWAPTTPRNPLIPNGGCSSPTPQ